VTTTYDSFARLYDADYANYLEDVPFYAELARRTGGPILELMCGTGRVLLPLADEGYQITGVDISTDMLDLARQKVAEAGYQDRVTLQQADIRRGPLPGGFRLVFIAVNSFMHMETVSEQLAALTTIRSSLRRDGVLVIDLFSPNPHDLAQNDGRLLLANTFELDGAIVQKFVSTDTDLTAQTDYVTFIYDQIDKEGRIIRRTLPFSLRWLFRYELEHLLVRAGYELEAIFGSYELDEYGVGSERLIALAHVR
jgi:SAM-dependent methyltransferase